MPWKDSPVDVLWVAHRYYRSQQFVDARVEYEKAADLARQQRNVDLETTSLTCAWECVEHEQGRESTLADRDLVDDGVGEQE